MMSDDCRQVGSYFLHRGFGDNNFKYTFSSRICWERWGEGHFNLIFITILWFIFSNITIIGFKCSSSLICKSSIEVNDTCNLNRVLHFVIISRVCGAF